MCLTRGKIVENVCNLENIFEVLDLSIRYDWSIDLVFNGKSLEKLSRRVTDGRILSYATSFTFLDYNECVNNDDNDCSSNAACTSTTTAPGFTCACSAGFRDKNTTNLGRM